MGLLLNGKWTEDEPSDLKRNSKNVRFSKGFSSFVCKEDPIFLPEKNRYLLLVNYTCPWSHLTMIGRVLKGLQTTIPLVFLNPVKGPRSWRFYGEKFDTAIQASHLYELYIHSKKDFTGRVTIPVLWDQKNKIIVNNNSSEILQMFDTSFEPSAEDSVYSLNPKKCSLKSARLNRFISNYINDGIYRCLLSKTDVEKKSSERFFFKSLTFLDSDLQKRRYLVDEIPTEADWRLFVTLIRFELIYSNLFFRKRQTLYKFKNIQDYLKRLFFYPQISTTIDFHKMVRGYYGTLGKKEDESKTIEFMKKFKKVL
ncbi:MAG: glutathione S-transferase C-terminal domain-containing protein [Pseudomonadota bacterium]|nr:glutathione S-transferase C-terminal domain-containing protein [Pseudomonadota bacterium]